MAAAKAKKAAPCIHARTYISQGGMRCCSACGLPLEHAPLTTAKTVENIPETIPTQAAPTVIVPALPHIFRGDVLPPLHIICERCNQYAWARFFGGSIVCTFCHPPQTWDALRKRMPDLGDVYNYEIPLPPGYHEWPKW